MARAVLLFLQGLISFSLFSQSIVEVNDSVDERNLMPNELTYYVDTFNTLSFDQVSSRGFQSEFRTHTSYQNKDFRANAAYWIRLPIRHKADTRKVWLLEFYDQTIDRIEAYVPQEGGTYQKRTMGDSQPFEQRMFRHKNFEVQLMMKSDTMMYYYFKVQSHEFADVRIAFRSANRFVYYALNEYFLYGTFYGMVLVISLFVPYPSERLDV